MCLKLKCRGCVPRRKCNGGGSWPTGGGGEDRQLAEAGALAGRHLCRRDVKGDLRRGGLSKTAGRLSLSQPRLDRGEAAVGRRWQGIRGFRLSLGVPRGCKESVCVWGELDPVSRSSIFMSVIRHLSPLPACAKGSGCKYRGQVDVRLGRTSPPRARRPRRGEGAGPSLLALRRLPALKNCALS